MRGHHRKWVQGGARPRSGGRGLLKIWNVQRYKFPPTAKELLPMPADEITQIGHQRTPTADEPEAFLSTTDLSLSRRTHLKSGGLSRLFRRGDLMETSY